MLSRFHLILERYGRTDGRTDRQTGGQICYITQMIQNIVIVTMEGE